MSPILILFTIAAYFAVLFSLSYYTSRKTDNAGFFSGNRRSPWYVVAFATIGAAISGITFVSVPGMVAVSGFSYLQMVLGFVVGQILIAFVLIPLFYRMNLVSIYEYLENRFGLTSYVTGAWIFFISKMLGASVRLLVVCVVLQLLVFEPFGIPFILNVLFTVAIVWFYTFRGGVKSLIWTDSLKTFCLILSAGLCIYYIADNLDGNIFSLVLNAENGMSKTFFFDDINDPKHFLKQFFAGIFTVIALTGLDQDLMQRTMSCKNFKDAQKNLIIGGVLQVFINLLFLVLGVLLYLYAIKNGIGLPKGDEVFPFLATNPNFFPLVVGVLFIIGLTSAAYAAAGSALTALTTSFTIDILKANKGKTEQETAAIRNKVHICMALCMGLVIYIINLLNDESIIVTVYRLASYTYGPLLGMFVFGIFTKWQIKDRLMPLIVIISPILCLILDLNSKAWFNGYEFSHERLILNAIFTFVGLCLLKVKEVYKK
jgi:SSS family transporter